MNGSTWTIFYRCTWDSDQVKTTFGQSPREWRGTVGARSWHPFVRSWLILIERPISAISGCTGVTDALSRGAVADRVRILRVWDCPPVVEAVYSSCAHCMLFSRHIREIENFEMCRLCHPLRAHGSRVMQAILICWVYTSLVFVEWCYLRQEGMFLHGVICLSVCKFSFT